MNKNHLEAEEVKRFVDLLKEMSCKPFPFDTTVSYPDKRTARKAILKLLL